MITFKNSVFCLILLITNTLTAKAFWFTVPKKKDAVHSFGNYSKMHLNPGKINLLVWNIYKGKKKDWEEDFLNLSKNSDLLILQEGITNKKMMSAFEKIENKSFYMGTSFIYKKSKYKTGVITGSTVKPTRAYAKKSKNVEWLGLTPKMLLFTEYPIKYKKEKLLAVNIHAINLVPWYLLARQIKQAGKKIKKHKGPVVFAGDFNTWNKKKMKFMKKYLTSLGMSEVIFPNGDERMKFKLTNKALDHVWVKGLDYEDAYVWSQFEGSDHKAMTLTLKVK